MNLDFTSNYFIQNNMINYMNQKDFVVVKDIEAVKKEFDGL